MLYWSINIKMSWNLLMVTYNSGSTLIRWGVSINSRKDLLLYLLVLGFFLLMYALSTSTQSFLNFVSDLPLSSIQEMTGNRESSNKYYRAHFGCRSPFKPGTSSLNGLSKANQGLYSLFCFLFYFGEGASHKNSSLVFSIFDKLKNIDYTDNSSLNVSV